jgi:hypothetical protein
MTGLSITAAMEPIEASIAFGDVASQLRVAAVMDEITATVTLAYTATSGLTITATMDNISASLELSALYLAYRPGFAYYLDDALLEARAWANGPGSRSMWAAAENRLVLTDIVRFAAPKQIALHELAAQVQDLASDSTHLFVLCDGALQIRENDLEAELVETVQVPGGQVVTVPEVSSGYRSVVVAGAGIVAVVELDAAGTTAQTDFQVTHQDATGVWLEMAVTAASVTYQATVFSADAKARAYTVRRSLDSGELVVRRQTAEFDVPNMKDAFQPFNALRQARYLTSEAAPVDTDVVLPGPFFNLVQEFALAGADSARSSQARYDPQAFTLRNADRDETGAIIRHTDGPNTDLPVPSIWLPRTFYRRVDGGHAICHPQVGAVSRIMPESLQSEQTHSVGDDFRILSVYTAEWGAEGWEITSSSSTNSLAAVSDSGWESTRQADAFRIQRTIVRANGDPEVVPDAPVDGKPPYDFIVAASSAEDLFYFNGLTTARFERPADAGGYKFFGTTRGAMAHSSGENVTTEGGDDVYRVRFYRNSTYGLTEDDWTLLGTVEFPRESDDVFDSFVLLAETHDGYLIFRGRSLGDTDTTYVVDTADPTTLRGYYRQAFGLVFDPVGVPDAAGNVYFQGGTYLVTPYTGAAGEIQAEDPDTGGTATAQYVAVRKADGRTLGSVAVRSPFEVYAWIFTQDAIGDPTGWTLHDEAAVGLPSDSDAEEVLAVGDSFYLAGMQFEADAFGFLSADEAQDGVTTGDGSTFSFTARESIRRALYARYSDGTWYHQLRVNTTADPDDATGTDELRPLFPPPY